MSKIILPKAVCFDLDGCLIDATDWHYEALNKALGLFGYSIKRGDHIKVYNGLPTKEKLKIMSQQQSLPVGLHEVIDDQKKIYTNELIQLRCRPAYDKILMLEYLQSKGVKLVCCSNAIQVSVEDMLKRAMIDHFFEHIIGNDVGFTPKPAPDIYLEAFRRLEIDPKDIWIVEDAPHGIEAAKASNAGRVIEVSGYNEVNLSLFTNLI
jgi:beta-phosphoglucomutase